MACNAPSSLTAIIKLNVSPAALWETIQRPEIMPKIMPGYISHCEFIEGDGRVGSIRLMKFGPVASDFVTFSKEKIEEVDDDNKKVVYSVIDGELLNYFKVYKVTLTVKPGEEENTCEAYWDLEYEPMSPEIPPPELSKEGAINTFKALESYILTSTA